ncbi:DUF159-domain-containing protein [Wolfiporia cocos MD-104 SS10]|uniref:DUF159-domain-containing protein n=1 Tax=Wolfiporia cocos (strain MD-104) TaxID=742152 RepID=A0A2H3JSZ3_WOLCO|nr:DUF159-domain-containing protein [Wolfiporia cocos MD-104 SS10]
MCGRYALGRPHAAIYRGLRGRYNAPVIEWVGEDRFQPRFNIAPRSQAPVLRRRESAPQDDSERSIELVLHTMRWGLVPHWSKHDDQNLKTINARAENLIEGGGTRMWNSIKGKKRCAIVCDGYYEWLVKGRERLPHFTKLESGELILLAGLYDSVLLEGQTQPLWTYTIVTTNACKSFAWLHDRQPAILSTPAALHAWLDTSSHKWSSQLSRLLDPYADDQHPLTCYQVPKEVGKTGNESATFVEPIKERKDGIQAMFARQQSRVSSPSPYASPEKRKREPTPDITEQKSISKKAKIQKVNAWEDVSEIDYVDDPVKPIKQAQGCEITPKTDNSAMKTNTSENDTDVEIIDAPSRGTAISTSGFRPKEPSVSSATSSPSKRSRPAEKPSQASSRKTLNAESPGKITSYFAKAP